MAAPIGELLGGLVDAVPSPQRDVRRAGRAWHARMWDGVVALEVEVDHTQGLFVLVSAIDDDGRPHTGPYLDRSGQVVRRHLAELLHASHPELCTRLRDVMGTWPYPDLGGGDWAALTSLCLDLWDVIRGLDPFGGPTEATIP